MAMTAMNNSAAMMSLGELNKNISRVGKDLKKVASGMRLSGAGDDASGYAISEKMRTRIRALAQDDQNVQNGVSLLKIAAGGIDGITDELRSLKELAINAANDTNTDADRATIQKEFDQRRAQIDAIASETTYNGKVLLDGRYERKTVTWTKTQVIPGTPATMTSMAVPVDASVVGVTGTVVHSGAVEPTGAVTKIDQSDYTITKSGVYELVDGKSHDIYIASGVHDVKFTQDASKTINNIHITGPADGNANIWVESINISNNIPDTLNNSFIKFLGTGNTLNFTGKSILYSSTGGTAAAIHPGQGLTVEGGTDGSGEIDFTDQSGMSGAFIGSDGEHDMSTANITINSGTYHAQVLGHRYGALIGSGCRSSIGDLVVNGGTFDDASYQDVTIGGGSDKSSCGNIVVKNAKLTATNKHADPIIGNGAYDGECGNIYIANCDITVRDKEDGAGIGSSMKSHILSDVVIENSVLDIECEKGAGIGSGESGSIGGIIINKTDTSHVKSQQGEDIGRGVNGTCGSVRYDVPVSPSFIQVNTTSSSTPDKVITTEETTSTGNPLVIHHGTKANEAVHFYLKDMRTNALKGQISDSTGAFVDGDDIAILKNLSGDAKRRSAYESILREANGKTLDQASVRTQHDASVAMRIIDGALDYALGEATTVGAYISRLHTTDANIVTMNETTIASESTIRDADMAKEMASYMKNNVLLQASESMLAQANQSSGDVLKLLQ